MGRGWWRWWDGKKEGAVGVWLRREVDDYEEMGVLQKTEDKEKLWGRRDEDVWREDTNWE